MFNIYYYNNLDGDKTSSREESNIFCWKEVTRKFLKNILNSDFGKKEQKYTKECFQEIRQEDMNITEWDIITQLE